MIKITDKEVYSTEGKYVHRIGTEAYFKRCSKLPNDTEEMFEEVDEIPEHNPEDDTFKQQTEEKVKAMFFASGISSQINTFSLTNKEVLAVKEYFPKWEEFIGKRLEKGFKFQYKESLYEVIQTVPSVVESQTPDIVPANYGLVSEHEGTKEDPIPYVQMMLIRKDKYYTQNGKLYVGIMDAPNGYAADLDMLPTLVQEVKE